MLRVDAPQGWKTGIVTVYTVHKVVFSLKLSQFVSNLLLQKKVLTLAK